MPDNLSIEHRRRTMQAIRRRDTVPELTLRRALHSAGLRYRLDVAALPGRPDVVFSRARTAVFIDGDFWHGWRFPSWAHSLAPEWRAKIAGNRARDVRNRRRLRRMGWTVIRVWEHEISRNPAACASRIATILSERAGAQ